MTKHMRKGKAKGKGKTGEARVMNPPVRDMVTFKSQTVVRMWIPGNVAGLLSSNAGGIYLLAGSIVADPTGSKNWSTKFQNVFEEYRVVKCKVRFTATNNLATFPLWHYWDEQNTTNLTYLTGPLAVAEKDTTMINMDCVATGNAAHGVFESEWVNKDFLDSSFVKTSSSPAGTATWKCYTDAYNFYAPITAASVPYATVQPLYLVEFRGLAAV